MPVIDPLVNVTDHKFVSYWYNFFKSIKVSFDFVNNDNFKQKSFQWFTSSCIKSNLISYNKQGAQKIMASN